MVFSDGTDTATIALPKVVAKELKGGDRDEALEFLDHGVGILAVQDRKRESLDTFDARDVAHCRAIRPSMQLRSATRTRESIRRVAATVRPRASATLPKSSARP